MPTKRIPLPSQPASGAGGYALAGYDYQIDVSIWLALDLVLANGYTSEVLVEPISEEDLEADLKSTGPGSLATTSELDGYRLIVQAKRRTGNAWTVADVNALLKHGKNRPSAQARLADPRARYLLVTNAAVNGGALDLSVRRAGSWPGPTKLPESIRSTMPAGAGGRIAIIERQDEERLQRDIGDLLTQTLRVPRARMGECVTALRNEVRARMLGAGSGRWTRAQLQAVIMAHDGYIASSPELDRYVHPLNWEDLTRLMEERYAALLVGQSGSGKSLAAKKLFEELSKKIAGLSWKPISDVRQMQQDRTKGPVLYFIEDPWGTNNFESDRRPWTAQLALEFAHARHDRLFIATSRLDVAVESGGLDSVRGWVLPLETEHYGPAQRRLLYRSRVDLLPRSMQATAAAGEQDVLGALATPLEIQKFFDALPTLEAEICQSRTAMVTAAIGRAHQDSIEQTVVDQIEARQDIRAAAVLWALLKANDRVSMKELQRLEEPLAVQDPALERGVRPLVQFFVAARNLRQVDHWVSYYHPRVEAAIVKALSKSANSLVARRTLKHLIDALLSRRDELEAWAPSTASRILRAADKVPELKPSVTPSTQETIDAWLAQQLPKGGSGFEDSLELGAAAGSADSNVAEAARFLLHRPDLSFPSFDDWGAPERSDAWYARLKADPAVGALIETFIVEVLPDTRVNFKDSFAVDLARLVPNSTAAFLRAAAKSVSYGVINNGSVIARGALADVAGFEAIVDAAVAILAPTAEGIATNEQEHLDITNEVYSDDYAEHLASNDDGYTAWHYLQEYVDHRRSNSDWASISSHQHAVHLLPFWLRSLARDPAPAEVEVSAALAAGFGHEEEQCLWRAIETTRSAAFDEPFMRRVSHGHPRGHVRSAALACLARRTPSALGDIIQELLQKGRDGRVVEIATELSELRASQMPPKPSGGDDDGSFIPSTEDPALRDALLHAYESLEPLVQEVCDAVVALERHEAPQLSSRASAWLSGVEGGNETVRWLRLRLGGEASRRAPEDVHWC